MFKFTIKPDGGTSFDIEAGMRDLRMWEKTHKGRVFGQIANAEGMSATALYEIAYAACRRQQLIPADVTENQFADGYDLDLIEDEDEDEDGTGPEDPIPAGA
jgi:hypothetical protein